MNITIIGGGLAGASAGYHLIKLGHNVTLYDRQDKGQATFASAGIICPWVSQRRNKKWYRLVTKSAHYYPEFISTLERETGMSTGYKNSGAICLFKENIFDKATKRISAKGIDNPDVGAVRQLSKEELSALHPSITTEYPALIVEGGGQVRGRKLLAALKEAFIHHGGTWKNESYDETTDDGSLKIYTTGAWGAEQTYKPDIAHQRAEIMHFKLKNQQDIQSPVVMALGPTYIVHLEKDEYVIGTTHIDTGSFDTSPTDESYNYLQSELYKYFKKEDVEITEMGVGLKPYTRDFLPFIGYVDDNTFVINGMGSTGLTASPYVGHEVSHLISGLPVGLDFSDYNYIEPQN
ncbi:tRNA 5-methylaminomethyl-2-thiouridine biosynthesis bifunctional protein MnmC [Jeotgalicoccus saudimassiliensis]|uniref:tRNA 5-methylaminomethyl-2-thiouridine biosynthesis bifunctional protein MnmC n=1 Tax=Jeotgalicoccus saudimassiliensis TaxID=1461582 RepID=A0A078MGV8_9STAP|nr:FAD-dependent oxidoreductase [Jeotgalicoccus saudimassiliensis]CEA03931.1 tRNA 5-methylaminomethyl-2-thiouridine biosynthesis bifunctional protein MnmC [Jeotgalicoccus saudimassiliensis]